MSPCSPLKTTGYRPPVSQLLVPGNSCSQAGRLEPFTSFSFQVASSHWPTLSSSSGIFSPPAFESCLFVTPLSSYCKPTHHNLHLMALHLPPTSILGSLCAWTPHSVRSAVWQQSPLLCFLKWPQQYFQFYMFLQNLPISPSKAGTIYMLVNGWGP